MPELGKKYTCYSCHTKFYDLGKPEPICPKCGADQRDADEAPVVAPARRSRDFGGEGEASNNSGGDDEDEEIVADDREEEEDEEEDEEY